MLLLTHIYNMSFTEVCTFIGSLEKSDKGSDWWRATLRKAGALTSFPQCSQLSAKPEQSALHPSAAPLLCSLFSDVAAGGKGMQSHALVHCPLASLFTLHSST